MKIAVCLVSCPWTHLSLNTVPSAESQQSRAEEGRVECTVQYVKGALFDEMNNTNTGIDIDILIDPPSSMTCVRGNYSCCCMQAVPTCSWSVEVPRSWVINAVPCKWMRTWLASGSPLHLLLQAGEEHSLVLKPGLSGLDDQCPS